MCGCMCIYVETNRAEKVYVCVRIHRHVQYTYTSTSTYTFTYTCTTYTYINVYRHVHVHLHLHLRIYVYVYVPMHVHANVHNLQFTDTVTRTCTYVYVETLEERATEALAHTSTPELPFKTPQIPSNRDHQALNKATLGGPGIGLMCAAAEASRFLQSGLAPGLWWATARQAPHLTGFKKPIKGHRLH